MLSPDDQELVRRDGAIQGLRMVLDPDLLSARLGEVLPGSRVGGAEGTYVRYKPGTSCLGLYRVRIDGRVVPVHVVAVAQPLLVKIDKAIAHALRSPGAARGVFAWREDGVQVSLFPHDRRLRALARLDRPGREQLLGELLRLDEGTLAGASIDALAYKPERRFVGGVRSDGGVLGVVKLHTRPGFSRLESARLVEIDGEQVAVRWPRRLGSSPRRAAVGWEWVNGVTVWDEIQAGRGRSAVRCAGTALAAFHRVARLVPGASPAYPAGGWPAAEAVVALVPRLADRMGEICRQLERTAPPRRPPVVVHGDYYAKQLVLASGLPPAVIDLDAVQLGPPEADLGNFLAHLEFHSLGEGLAGERLGMLAASLMEGYLDAGGVVDPQALAWERAVALLRMAPHAFRTRQPGWLVRTEGVVARVASRLEEAAVTAVGSVA